MNNRLYSLLQLPMAYIRVGKLILKYNYYVHNCIAHTNIINVQTQTCPIVRGEVYMFAKMWEIYDKLFLFYKKSVTSFFKG